MKQKNQHVKRSAPTASQQAGRGLTARKIASTVARALSTLALLAGPTITLIFTDPLAGQSLLGMAAGVVVTLAGALGLAVTGKTEPPQPTEDSHKSETREAHTKMIDGGVMVPNSPISHPNRYAPEGVRLAANLNRLRQKSRLVAENLKL